MKANSPLEIQVGGSHYKGLAMQPVQFANIAGLGFCEGSVVKYICRWRKKKGLEDIQKAGHFLELLLEAIDRNQYNLPLIFTEAPLKKFLDQFPELSPMEREVVRAVTVWRRYTGREFTRARKQIQLLRDAVNSIPKIAELAGGPK